MLSPGDPLLLWRQYPSREISEGDMNIHGHIQDRNPPTETSHIKVSDEQFDYKPIENSVAETGDGADQTRASTLDSQRVWSSQTHSRMREAVFESSLIFRLVFAPPFDFSTLTFDVGPIISPTFLLHENHYVS